MEEVWDRLRKATSNDIPLVDFLQRLLTLDSNPRADFAALANDTYVQTDIASPAVANAPIFDAPTASRVGPMPSEGELSKAVRRIPGVQGHELDALESVPGIAFLVWDPAASPVCETASGAVCR